MKKLIVIFVLMLISISLAVTQDIEPTPFYFQYYLPNSSIPQVGNLNPSLFPQQSFELGSQWGAHPKMAQALKFTTIQSSGPYWLFNGSNTNYLDFSINTGPTLNYISGQAHGSPSGINASFKYKPTLIVNPNNFIPNNNDPERNIWGFQSCGIQSPDTTGNKLNLTQKMNFINPILSNPWMNNRFYCIDTSANSDKMVDGKYFIISVNLRRKDFTNNIKDTTSVLTITLPYYLCQGSTNQNDSILFDAIPDTSSIINLIYTYQVGTTFDTVKRGYYYGTKSIPTNYKFVITRAMLPNNIDSINGIGPNITLSANFTCDNNKYNPFFKTKDGDTNKIDSIGCNVYYNPSCPISLNYIRISVPASDILFRGGYDTATQAFWEKRYGD